MRITTKRGDGGLTGLAGGKRVSKCSPVIKTMGALDEAISFLGLAKAKTKNRVLKDTINFAQRDLFRIIAELCRGAGECKELKGFIKAVDVKRLEKIAGAAVKKAKPPKSFVIPGVNEESAYLHVARTVVRRAECMVVELNKKRRVNRDISAYLNRLSDLLFILALLREGRHEVLRYE
ncbi:MAG: cob(I)yrinic acid a,c-diamide adenosyltransferase [Candidatus Omnitrophota bacterium]